MCGNGSAVGHPWHPDSGGMQGTLGTLVVGACGAPLSPWWCSPLCYCVISLISCTHTLTPPFFHTYRVFFSQRVYKELTLSHAPLLPAIRDAHVGSHDSWAVEDNDVVIL